MAQLSTLGSIYTFMLQFIITQTGDTHQSAGLSTTTLNPSETVHPIEVAALWQSIKDGRFERDAKAMLTTFCKENGFDAGEYL